MQMVKQEASGHDFVDGLALQLPEKCKWWSTKRQGTTSSMGWLYSFRKNASGGARSVRARLRRWGGFTASGKMQVVKQEASGHDFVDGVALQLPEKCKWWSKKCQGTTSVVP